MADHVDIELIVPAYNEEGRIGPVTEAVTAYLSTLPFTSRLTIVDNGSADRTTEVVDRAHHHGIPVHVLGCARPGKGAAVRRGVLASNSRFVGFADADLSTPIQTLDPILNLLFAGRKFVVASRRCEGAEYAVSQSLTRRLGGKLFRSVSSDLAGHVKDTQCGFKFFESATGKALFSGTSSDGYAFDLELIALARKIDIPIDEVPIRWADSEGSSFSMVSHGISTLLDIQRVRGRFRTLDADAPAELLSASARD